MTSQTLVHQYPHHSLYIHAKRYLSSLYNEIVEVLPHQCCKNVDHLRRVSICFKFFSQFLKSFFYCFANHNNTIVLFEIRSRKRLPLPENGHIAHRTRHAILFNDEQVDS